MDSENEIKEGRKERKIKGIRERKYISKTRGTLC